MLHELDALRVVDARCPDTTSTAGAGSLGSGTGPAADSSVPAKLDYAIRALCALAAAPPGTPLSTESLARREHLPAKFLGAILTELRRGGVVTSRRGQVGGYLLVRPAAQTRLADVLDAIDIPPRGSGASGSCGNCGNRALREVWRRAEEARAAVLRDVTLADLIEPAHFWADQISTSSIGIQE
jgi:Rrf2 family protein